MPSGRALALLLLSAGAAAAQHNVDLYGRILDASDAGIGQAGITVVNEETGFRRITWSDPTGGYMVASLQPGAYKVTVRKEGFRTVMRFGVPLPPSGATRADFVLPIGSVEETITVEGVAPLLQHDDASTGTRVDRGEIERLPLNGRGLLGLIEFTPGANVIPATRGEAGQFTATGQRANANYFTVDGASANTGVIAGGRAAQSTGGALPALSAYGSMDSLISVEAISELRVTTSTSIAEFGRLPGAVVALTSRSGSNEFHGGAAYRVRNELFAANDWFANQAGYGRLPLRLHDFTGALGGPMRRNRTFFFLSYQHVSMLQPIVWVQPVPSLSARESAQAWAVPVLSLFPNPTHGDPSAGLGEWVGRSTRPAALHTGGARLDQAIGDRITLFGRYNDSPSRNDFGGLAVNQLDLRTQSLTIGLNARIAPAATVDVHLNESQATANSLWNPGDGCALQSLTESFSSAPSPCDYLVRFWIGGVGQLVSGLEGLRRQRQFQFIGAAAFHPDGHAFALGADYRAIRAIRRDPTGALAVIADDVTGLADRRKLWLSSATGQNGEADVRETSLWFQDTWQATRRLTLSYGVRWEHSPPPLSDKQTFFYDYGSNSVFSGQHELWMPSLRHFAPRFGLAWQLSRDGRTVLRAGGGLYYDSSLSIATDILNGGPLNITSLTSSIHSPASSLLSYGFMPDLRLPYVGQWSATLERAFGSQTVASLGYVGSSARDLILREVGGRGSTFTALVALTTNSGESDYHGLQAQIRRRMSRSWQALASYTWSHSIDNASSDAFLLWGISGPDNRGSSDFDLRQAFNGSVSYEPAWAKGWSLDGIFRARTGFPITVLQSEEYEGIALANAFRPDLVYGQPLWVPSANTPGGRQLNPAAFTPTVTGVQGALGRNAIAGFGMAQLDLALRREFRFTDQHRLLLRIEAFNALNHPNFADPTRDMSSPVFGQSASMLNLMLGTGSPGSGLSPLLQTGGSRSLQAVLKFQF